MNNEQNNTQTNDFEIIDIPVENNNVESNGVTPQPEIEQLDFDVEPQAPVQPELQPQVEMPVQQEVQPTELTPQPEMSVQLEPQVQPDLVASEIVEPQPTSFAEIPVQPENQVVDNGAMNTYVPANDVKKENNGKQKMAKSTKELIAMAILATLVIIFLPKMYDLTSGNYHITEKISNSITGLFGKKETKKTESTKKQTTKAKEKTTDTKEETMTETKDETNVANTLSFDFSSYNNQIVDRTKIQTILDEYKNNIVDLTSVVENNIQTINIKIVKDKTNVQSNVANPDTDIEVFKTQNLNATLNYLVTVTDIDNNTTIIKAVQK